MVHSLKLKLKKFHITHILRDYNWYTNSLVYLGFKSQYSQEPAIIIEVRGKPSYAIFSLVNIITNIKKISDTNIKDTWMKPLLHYSLRNNIHISNLEVYIIQFKAKLYIIINGWMYLNHLHDHTFNIFF